MAAAKVSIRHSDRRLAGVTLTEVIVASALLVISIIPLLRALTIAQMTDRAVERKSWSLMLAQAELDRIRDRSVYGYDHDFNATSSPLCSGYLCSVADDRDPGLRTVTVFVGADRNGDGILSSEEIEVRLGTRLARRWPGPE